MEEYTETRGNRKKRNSRYREMRWKRQQRGTKGRGGGVGIREGRENDGGRGDEMMEEEEDMEEGVREEGWEIGKQRIRDVIGGERDGG